MIKFGLPVGAAKLKMQADGLDPSILDLDPDGPSPSNDDLQTTAFDASQSQLTTIRLKPPSSIPARDDRGPNLLDQIKKGSSGKNLRKVGVIERKKPEPDARTNLLDAIKGGVSNLRKVDRSSINEEKKTKSQGFGGEVLARLEALRANVALSDSDSDSESDWEG